MNKTQSLFIILLSLLSLLSGQEEQGSAPSPSDYRPVDGLEQWTYTFDVSDLKKGN